MAKIVFLEQTFKCPHCEFINHCNTLKFAWVEIVTLPALQQTFVDFLFEFAWGFGIENGEEFRWILSGLRFQGNKTWKVLKQFRENSEQNSGQNSGPKLEKFGELLFSNCSDLRNRRPPRNRRQITRDLLTKVGDHNCHTCSNQIQIAVSSNP